MAQTLETDADVGELLSAVGDNQAFVVRLEADPDTLAARVIAREPPTFAGAQALAEHACELAASMSALRGVDLVLGAADQQPAVVAARIRRALPSPLT